jgi:hypothetical protein
MTCLPRLRSVEDEEEVIGVGVDLREMAAIEQVANCQAVEAEQFAETVRRHLVAGRQIDPDKAARLAEEALNIRPGLGFRPGIRDPANDHRIGVYRGRHNGRLSGHVVGSIRRSRLLIGCGHALSER